MELRKDHREIRTARMEAKADHREVSEDPRRYGMITER